MGFSGGVYSRFYSWRAQRDAAVDIDSTQMDAEDDGFAAGLSNVICRDGQSTITGNIPFSGNKITGLGDATNTQDGMNQRASDARYQRQAGGAISTANSVSASTIDLSLGRSFYKTVSGGLTWVFSNPASFGGLDGFVLELTNGGTGTQTWPASVRWPNGAVPTLTTAGTDVLVFITRDGGTTWRGSISQRNSS